MILRLHFIALVVAVIVTGPAAAAPPYPASSANELDAAVRSACAQIDGVSLDGKIFYQPGATCKTAGDAAMASFVPTDPAIEQARRAAIKEDADRVAMLARLKTATPAQIENWINNNAASLSADARKVLATILKMIALDPR